MAALVDACSSILQCPCRLSYQGDGPSDPRTVTCTDTEESDVSGTGQVKIATGQCITTNVVTHAVKKRRNCKTSGVEQAQQMTNCTIDSFYKDTSSDIGKHCCTGEG